MSGDILEAFACDRMPCKPPNLEIIDSCFDLLYVPNLTSNRKKVNSSGRLDI